MCIRDRTITLSFYVRSNLTGTFGGVIKNSANDRTYIFSYSISSANTWERKSITIPGDTTGTWLTTNGTGIIINWGLALGSNWTGTAGSYVTSDKHGVTGQLNLLSSTDNEWLLTGVQLEVGTQATAFEHRSFAEELTLCQRYYEGVYMSDGTALMKSYLSYGGSANFEYQFKVQKRAIPTWSLEGNAAWAGATPNAYESQGAAVFQDNGGTLFALGDASGDLCGSFDAEL